MLFNKAYLAEQPPALKKKPWVQELKSMFVSHRLMATPCLKSMS